jgi:hypothetical protein
MKRSEIIKRTKYWQEKLGLKNWEILIKFEKLKQKSEGHLYELARCQPNSHYLQATINFLPSQLSLIRDEDIIHELLHCHTSELVGYLEANIKKNAWGNYFEERLVSQLARIYLGIIK